MQAQGCSSVAALAGPDSGPLFTLVHDYDTAVQQAAMVASEPIGAGQNGSSAITYGQPNRNPPPVLEPRQATLGHVVPG